MLKVSVRDFGPIIEGSVNLKPLTIFVGPSNAGKSYMAMLVYSLMQSLGAFPIFPYGGLGYEHLSPRRLARGRAVLRRDIGLEINEGVVKAISNWAQNIEVNRGPTLEISFMGLPEEVRNQINRIVQSSLQAAEGFLNGEIQRCHGNISDIRSHRTGAHLQIDLEQDHPLLRLRFEEEQDSLRTLSSTELDMSQSRLEIPRSLVSTLQAEAPSLRRRPSDDLQLYSHELLAMLSGSASATLFREFPESCYYLPAARSGIAQGHKAIASILVRQSSFAAIRPFEIPTLSGIITDFMGHILTMERAGGFRHRFGTTEMEGVVDFLEREVVRGEIDIERGGEVTYPEISYAPITGQPDMGKFPFHRTSSMVSEVAPVVLFLKYLVDPEDLIILEEPESHLHPASQRQMARGIARLVNAGVKVIITTHSDYFIGQVNNLLKLGSASRQKRTKEGYAAADCLKADDVGAYHFQLDDSLGGSRIEELPIVPGFGIDEQDIAAVSEELYQETISLQRIKAK